MAVKSMARRREHSPGDHTIAVDSSPMGRGTAVPVTPSVLAWAISESGYKERDVAAKLKVPLSDLHAWLEGRDQPTLTRARALASLLKRPLSTFLLPRPPERTRPHVEFRHPPTSRREALNPTELRHLREAARLQRGLEWILTELNEASPQIPKARVDDEVERIAEAARRHLGVSPEDQLRWADAGAALENWRTALERSGVAVLLLQLGKESCRGFSLWNDRAPLIALNTWWNPSARIFTLFHEYGHLLTRTNSACVLGRYKLGDHSDPTERWCERFAASFLLPWPNVFGVLQSETSWRQGSTITKLEPAQKIVRRFKVSLRAAVLWLIERGIAQWELFESIPAIADDKPTGGGGGGRTRLDIREDEYGRHATQLFVKALDRDVVGYGDVIDYLDIADADIDELRSRATFA